MGACLRASSAITHVLKKEGITRMLKKRYTRWLTEIHSTAGKGRTRRSKEGRYLPVRTSLYPPVDEKVSPPVVQTTNPPIDEEDVAVDARCRKRYPSGSKKLFSPLAEGHSASTFHLLRFGVVKLAKL